MENESESRINEEKTETALITIKDLEGRIITSIDISKEQGRISVNTETLNDGVYICSFIIDGGRTINKKLVIIK